MELLQKPMEWSGERTSTHCKVLCKDECKGTSDPSKRWVESGDPFSTQRKKGGWKLYPKPLSIATVEREEGRRERTKGKKRRQGRRRRELEKNHTRRHGFRSLHILSTLLFSLCLQSAHLQLQFALQWAFWSWYKALPSLRMPDYWAPRCCWWWWTEPSCCPTPCE